MLTTQAAAEIALRCEYKKWVNEFWRIHTSLSQIIIEDFPDPDDAEARPTRYHVDAIRGLALQEGALTQGYERQ